MKRLLVLLFLCPLAFADVTTNNPSSSQTNSSGSNTSIQSYEAVTNYNSGSTPVTNNTTTNSTSNNSKTAVAPANAPNLSCLLYTSPSPRDGLLSRMPSSA